MQAIGLVEGPEFVQGETDTDRDYAITQARAPFDLTGYSGANLYAVGQVSGTKLGPIAGSILAPSTAAIVRFNHDTITAVSAAEEWRAQVELVHPTKGTRRIPRKIRIPVSARVEAA